MKPWQFLIYGLLLGLIASGLILLISQPVRGTPLTLNPAPTPTQTIPPRPTATPAPIVVQIYGQVINPGIYYLEKDARLNDLVTAAGGLTIQADIVRINQAILLRDGDYLYIPANGEDFPETANNAPQNLRFSESDAFDYPLNINMASQAAFESLPGIGPAKAAEIIQYRDSKGGFSAIEDLLNVPGIGQTTLDRILDYLYIEP